MIRIRPLVAAVALLAISLSLFVKPASAAPQTLRGTATSLDGSPLSGGTIDLMDSNGILVSAQANKNGKFAIPITTLTPPFLLRGIPAGGGSPLYGLAFAKGIADIDVYTDLSLNLIFGAQATTTAAQFAAPTMTPSASQANLVASMVQNAIFAWLQIDKVNLSRFNLLTNRFAANLHRFGKLVHQTSVTGAFSGNQESLEITDGTRSEDITFTADPLHGTVSASGTMSDDGNVTTLQFSTAVPDLVTASYIENINATLAMLQNLVVSKKKKLTSNDLMPLFDPAYLHSGENQTVGTADTATSLRAAKMKNAAVSQLNAVNPDPQDNSQVDVNVAWTFTGARNLPVTSFDIFRCPIAGGDCLFFGDQLSLSMKAKVILETVSNQAGLTNNQYLDIEVLAPDDPAPIITGATVQDSGEYFPNPTALFLLPTPVTQTFYPTASTTLDFTEADWLRQPIIAVAPPSPATPYDITVAPVNGPQATYQLQLSGSVGEPITLVKPLVTGDHSLAAAPIGKFLTVKWTPPLSYSVARVDTVAKVANAGCTQVTTLNPLKAVKPYSTSARFKLPKTMPDGSTIGFVQFNLGLIAQNGGVAGLKYQYGSCS